MTLLLLVQQLVNSYQNINSYYHSMRRSSVANFSQTQKTDLRSCQKPRTERKEVPPKPSILKRGDKTRYSRADESEADEKMNKITNYFESNSKQKPLQEVHFDQNNSKENKSSKSSDEQFQRIKAVNQSLRSKLLVQKQEKRKIQMTVAANMLEIADIKRKEKRRVDKKLGHFTDNFKRFVEGTLIYDLREQLKETELAVSKLNEEKNNCGSDDTQYNCIVSSYQFKSKQCSQIRKELDAREKEMIEYRQKLRLADKQEKSYYSTRGWPIIYNKFQTLQLLGSGGFGEVYKCYDFQKQTIVAIKRMKFDPSMNSRHFQEFCRHVKREMQIQIKLKHPNIAKLQSILEFDEESRCIVFQLQYCRGPELSVYMKKQRIIEEKQAKLYIKQILCALDYLYKLKDKIIHYDLKPSNIIFHEGVIKILDFGLCKKMDGNSDQTKINLTSQGVGTYWYLPPETFDPYDPMVSPKVDVWSVGVIFFEMIYGKRPFGHGMSQNQVLQKNIIRDATKVTFPPDPSKKNKISEEAKNFIRACLAYDTKDRLNPTEAYEHEYLNFKK